MKASITGVSLLCLLIPCNFFFRESMAKVTEGIEQVHSAKDTDRQKGSENTNPSRILAKAIQAHGGIKNILKPRKGYLKGVDTLGGDIRNPKIQFEEVFDLPNHWKSVIVNNIANKKLYDLMDQGKWWKWEQGGVPTEMSGDIMVASCFGLLIKLSELTNKKYILSPLSEVIVKGETAVGFRVKWAGYMADLYFSSTDGLLTRSDCIIELMPGRKYHQKSVFSAYKEIDGVKLPHGRSVFLKGGEFHEYIQVAQILVTEIRLVENLPDNMFSLPSKK